MKKLIRRVLVISLFAAGLMACSFVVMAFLSKTPPELGVENGRLKDCADSPNCVNSFSDSRLHALKPFQAAPGQTSQLLADLTAAVEQMPRMRLIEESENYRRFECSSGLFKFVDDLEFLAVPEQDIVHVRSASRVGHSDLGVNRDRVESIRRALPAKQN